MDVFMQNKSINISKTTGITFLTNTQSYIFPLSIYQGYIYGPVPLFTIFNEVQRFTQNQVSPYLLLCVICWRHHTNANG